MDNSTYIIRNYRPADFNDYVKLYIAAAKPVPGGHDCSPQAISESLNRPRYSPEKDLFVAEIAGRVAGFMNIIPELATRRVILDCLVHPDHRRKHLATELLGQAISRARELKAKVARVNVSQDNTVATKVLPRLGFRIARRFLELRLLLTEAPLPETSHHTHTLRHLQAGEEEQLTQLQNRCFGSAWEYNPNTTEDMVYQLNFSYHSPEDVILTCEKDRPIGYCWTEIDPEATETEKKGRIYMFGVDPDYRSRGIGKKALLAGLSYLKSKGMRIVELNVDSENEVARNLYRSVGFKPWTTSLWYEKTID